MNRLEGTLLSLLVAGLFSVCPFGESLAEEPSEFRARFDRATGIPNRVMFPKFVDQIVYWSMDDASGNAHGHSHVVIEIQRKLGIDSYEDAEMVLNIISSIQNEISDEQQQFMRNEICPLDMPRPTGPVVLDKLDAYDDNIDNLGAFYLAEFRTQVTKDQYERFLSWMDDAKQGTKIYRLDHHVVHNNEDPDMVRQEVCGRFDNRVSGSSVNETD